jgi:hypothetical protein
MTDRTYTHSFIDVKGNIIESCKVNGANAIALGRYANAVKRAIDNNDQSMLSPFKGLIIATISGVRYQVSAKLKTIKDAYDRMDQEWSEREDVRQSEIEDYEEEEIRCGF